LHSRHAQRGRLLRDRRLLPAGLLLDHVPGRPPLQVSSGHTDHQCPQRAHIRVPGAAARHRAPQAPADAAAPGLFRRQAHFRHGGVLEPHRPPRLLAGPHLASAHLHYTEQQLLVPHRQNAKAALHPRILL